MDYDLTHLWDIQATLDRFLCRTSSPAANSWQLDPIVVEEATDNRQTPKHAIVCAAFFLDSLNRQIDEDVLLTALRILLEF